MRETLRSLPGRLSRGLQSGSIVSILPDIIGSVTTGGWPSVSVLWLVEAASLICNLYLSVAAR